MRDIQLRPTLNHDEAEKKFKGRYLTRADFDERPTEDVRGVLPNGQTAFVFLRNVFSDADVTALHKNVLSKLKFSDVKHSRRAGLKGLKGSKDSRGGELIMGWMDFPHPRQTGPARHQFDLYVKLFPLMHMMKQAVKKHLPAYYEQQMQIITRQPEWHPWLDLFEQDAAFFKMVEECRTESTRDTMLPLFSTLTINKTLLFQSHADAKNRGGLACLTAFGTFSGADFCLPRLRVAFPIRPGDLLIADNNNEQHGNIGPIVGNRISVVAYLRTMQREYDIPFWYPLPDGSAGPLLTKQAAAAAMGTTAPAAVKVAHAPTLQIQPAPVKTVAPSATPRKRLAMSEDEDVM
jgi:hypothetical protein